MIRGIQVTFIDAATQHDRIVIYLEKPQDFTIDCDSESFVVKPEELEQYVIERQKRFVVQNVD